MKGIGGNLTANLQQKTITQNDYGDHIESWSDVKTLKGWLDQTSGQANYQTYSAKIQESTHLFICDFVPLPEELTAENSRMVINGKRYDVMLIDNPMEMGSGSQWEIFLKFTGGQ